MKPLRQSFSWWCSVNKGIEPDALLVGAAKIGFEAVDLIDESLWPSVKRAGLTLGAINGHGTSGMSRPENAEAIEKELRENISKAKQWNIPVLICFTGNRYDGANDDEGLEQCAKVLSRLAPQAEEVGVSLAMELLNSRVDHPGFQCDHTAWGVELCKRVNSPAVKLLYDIYHMQIMEGDLIRTIRDNHNYISHYHTAGNPGRGQPDDTQEIYYPAVYRAIAETGFSGLVAHEFIPKGDPLAALKKAFDDARQALVS